MSGCPTPEALSRAFDIGPDAALRVHLEACGPCRAAWREMEALRRDARALTAAAPTLDADAARARLLAAAGAPTRVRPLAWAGLAAAVTMAAVLAGLTWRTSPPERVRTSPPTLRTTLHPGPDADVTRLGAQPDEVVRLRDGDLTVECAPLAEGERFRVVVGDAVVEVRGTAFDVVADDDRLRSVYVIRGSVEVRPAGRAHVTLGEGERWTGAPPPPSRDAGVAPSADAAAAPSAPARRRRARRPAPAVDAAAPLPLDAGSPARLADAGAPDATGPAATQDAAPARAEHAFTRGWAALTADRPGVAAAAFAEVQRRFPGDPLAEDAAFWQVVALGRADRVPAAITAARRFLDAWPASGHRAEAALLLAGWLHARGEDAQARAAYAIAARAADPAIRRRAEAGLRAMTGE